MTKELLNKEVQIICIDNQVINGIITEWEEDYIIVNYSTEIKTNEILQIIEQPK